MDQCEITFVKDFNALLHKCFTVYLFCSLFFYFVVFTVGHVHCSKDTKPMHVMWRKLTLKGFCVY